jgi:FSR family fosmidomycin resistance protein-like MFS transporter
VKTAQTAEPLSLQEIQVVSLVTAAHFLSHFYQFVLPPVFGLMAVKLNVGFTEMGLAITVFSIATGISQTPAGFLVDRLGASKLLILGVAIIGLAVACYGLVTTYWSLLPLAAIAGCANSIFHPADFAILSDQVAERRIGRAFSFHAVAGNLGWAAAPIVMLGISAAFDIETAFISVGLAGIVLSIILAVNIDSLEKGISGQVHKTDDNRLPRGQTTKEGLSLLLSRTVLMLFIFQLVYAMAFAGVRNFSVAALPAIWGIGAEVAAGTLTGYLLAASFGNIVGGWLADRTGNPARLFTFSILSLSALVASFASLSMSLAVLSSAFLTAGALQGSLLPARDMLVRQIAPPGQMGKLFGFTSSGLALGNAITPAIFGWVMDNADPRWVFWGSAACMLIALLTYAETRRQAG